MKVTRIETLRCDAGWRMFSFLKVMTDEGIVGWSEYNENGEFVLPARPGWGVEVNEAAVRARPPKD
jgi:L-alanine-DL-glutamate epimerase-like enolase superfamily enzyme